MTIRDWSEEFYKEIFQLAWLVSLPILKNQDDAEDVAAETVAKLFESEEKSGEQVSNPLAWARTAGKRRALNFSQKKKPARLDQTGTTISPLAPDPIESQEKEEEIDQMIERILTSDEKAVFDLYEQGYSDEEIAHQLNKGERPVADLRRKARKKLRDALGFPPRFPSQTPDSDE